MFHFFNKQKKQQDIKSEVSAPLSLEEQAKIAQEIQNCQNLIKQLLSCEKQDGEHLARAYEKLGLVQAENNIEAAIQAFESSLSYKLSIGEGYKKLMSLYNAKRAEAARTGDDQGIDLWMEKMDNMRQIAKKVTISGK